MPPERVLAISAQKGLVAKITGDDALLQASGLPVLEDALARGIMGQRQAILREAVATGVAGLRLETERVLNVRRRDLDEQILELRSLRGKNASVIGAMRARIEQEQREFDASAAKIQAVRSVHLRLLRELFVQLGARAQKEQLTQLSDTLQQRGLKLGARPIPKPLLCPEVNPQASPCRPALHVPAQPLDAALPMPAQQLSNETAAQLALLPFDDVRVMVQPPAPAPCGPCRSDSKAGLCGRSTAVV